MHGLSLLWQLPRAHGLAHYCLSSLWLMTKGSYRDPNLPQPQPSSFSTLTYSVWWIVPPMTERKSILTKQEAGFTLLMLRPMTMTMHMVNNKTIDDTKKMASVVAVTLLELHQ